MKKFLFTIVFCSFFATFFGFNNNPIQDKPEVGDTLIVLKNKGENYKFIKFPKRNIINKRGGVSSYKSVYNIEVVVTEVLENKHGRIYVKLKRTDGKKFFNQQKSVKAIYNKALEKGELKLKS